MMPFLWAFLLSCTANSADQVETDFELLRSIKGIVNRLPAMDNEMFRGDFLTVRYRLSQLCFVFSCLLFRFSSLIPRVQEQHDAALVNLLASMTKGEAMLSDVVEKYNSAFHSQKRGSLGSGMSRH
jgi:hypothetical protein